MPDFSRTLSKVSITIQDKVLSVYPEPSEKYLIKREAIGGEYVKSKAWYNHPEAGKLFRKYALIRHSMNQELSDLNRFSEDQNDREAYHLYFDETISVETLNNILALFQQHQVLSEAEKNQLLDAYTDAPVTGATAAPRIAYVPETLRFFSVPLDVPKEETSPHSISPCR